MTTVDMSGRRAFVTGAYGLLGGWLIRALLDAGAQVVALRRDKTPVSLLELEGLEQRVTVVQGDVCDRTAIERILAEHEIDTVFHLAAQTLVGIANRSPASTFEINVRGTWTVLEACRLLAVDRVVVAASDKAYGRQQELPFRETSPLQPSFPYDVSKAAADMIARCYWHTYGLRVAVTRFANLYGGGDVNFSRLVPEAVGAAIEGRRPVIRSDGSPERDYLYVEDAARAYLHISAALDSGTACGEAFNAGSGEPISVARLVQLICRIAGSDLEADILGAGTPAGEIDRQYVDSTKLRELTGWAPQVGLEEGLRRTIAWYRQQWPALGDLTALAAGDA
jgi:CDP-glucose 4,6-dehydratase